MTLTYDYKNNKTIARLSYKEYENIHCNLWLRLKGFNPSKPIKQNSKYIYFEAPEIVG